MAFRSGGIAFNAEFVRVAHAQRSSRATLFFDEQNRRVGVQFHSRLSDRDAYAVVTDGGGAGAAGGRLVQTGLIYESYPWLKAVLVKPTSKRRIPVLRDDQNDVWYVEVR
jgi:hypothetical protein